MCSTASVSGYFDETSDMEKISYRQAIEKIAKKNKWIVQLNGENLDVYCSKKCAE